MKYEEKPTIEGYIRNMKWFSLLWRVIFLALVGYILWDMIGLALGMLPIVVSVISYPHFVSKMKRVNLEYETFYND